MPASPRWLPAVCFGLGATLSLTWSCTDECVCPDAELVPTTLQIANVLPIAGSEPPLLSDGTVEISQTAVVIRYSRDGFEHVATYEIGAAATRGATTSSQ